MNESTGRREIEALIQGYLEESLTEDESRRLLASLRRDSSLATIIIESLRTDCLIRAVVSETAEVEDVPEIILPFPHPAETSLVPARPGRRRKHWSQVLALAACLAMLVGLSVWFYGPTIGKPVLASVQGLDVSIERGTELIPAANGMRFQAADVLRLGANETAMIVFGKEDTRIDVRAGTKLKVLDWTKGKRFDLEQGKLEASVARQRPFKPTLVRTPEAEAHVLGTRFTLTTAANRTRLDVDEGRVRFTRRSDGAAVHVGTGQYAIAAGGTELNPLPRPGAILREVWTGIPGGQVNDLLDHPNYPGMPAHRDLLKSFETGAIETNNYAYRLIGYIHPPITGDYTFWIASGGYAALWLSPDENPGNKARIAASFGGLPKQWDPPNPQGKFQMPQSPKVRLVAGQRYFIQAIQKTATGSSHLEVAWKIPGGEQEIISGEFLSPYKPKD